MARKRQTEPEIEETSSQEQVNQHRRVGELTDVAKLRQSTLWLEVALSSDETAKPHIQALKDTIGVLEGRDAAKDNTEFVKAEAQSFLEQVDALKRDLAAHREQISKLGEATTAAEARERDLNQSLISTRQALATLQAETNHMITTLRGSMEVLEREKNELISKISEVQGDYEAFKLNVQRSYAMMQDRFGEIADLAMRMTEFLTKEMPKR